MYPGNPQNRPNCFSARGACGRSPTASQSKRAAEAEAASKTVILPRKLQQLNVSELKIGESGWIFHEALKFDGNNRCWVYKWASIKDLRRPGYSQEENYIEIKRTSKGLVIGLVIVVSGKRKWDGETLEADHWYLPVAEVIIKYP